MFALFKVTGNSMSPSFNDGDFVLGLTKFISPKIGQVVVVQHSLYGRIIKRISCVQKDGILLAGDNPDEGVSTEAMGRIEQDKITARVIWRIKS